MKGNNVKTVVLKGTQRIEVYFKQKKLRLEVSAGGFTLWETGSISAYPDVERWIIDASVIRDKSFLVGTPEVLNIKSTHRAFALTMRSPSKKSKKGNLK